jgi:hypothetical protein
MRGAFIEMPLNGYIYLFVLAAGDLVLYDLVVFFFSENIPCLLIFTF